MPKMPSPPALVMPEVKDVPNYDSEAREKEARQAAAILGYNYKSGEWYERSYKVFYKKYKPKKITSSRSYKNRNFYV